MKQVHGRVGRKRMPPQIKRREEDKARAFQDGWQQGYEAGAAAKQEVMDVHIGDLTGFLASLANCANISEVRNRIARYKEGS